MKSLVSLSHRAEYKRQEITVELFDRPTKMKEKLRLSYWDAAIPVAAKLLGCAAVYSEDMNDQEDYDGLRVANPFLEASG